MIDPTIPLQQFRKDKDFLIGVDSDGCVFDTMESKMRRCIIPRIITDWDLAPIADLIRETGEFVNLYSVWRGMNRFEALIKVFDLAADRLAAGGIRFVMPEIGTLRQWVAGETQLSNGALEKAVRATGDPVLRRALQWALHINEDMKEWARGMPPFRFVRESMAMMASKADLMVISTATQEFLEREWVEQGFVPYVKALAGQEMGGKKEILARMMGSGYAPDRVLMIGDARGDLEAARANQVMFYPIVPGREADSWRQFMKEGLERFIAGRYAGTYQNELIAVFEQSLPQTPPWLMSKVQRQKSKT